VLPSGIVVDFGRLSSVYLKRFKTSIVCNQSSTGSEITGDNKDKGYYIVLHGLGYHTSKGLVLDGSEAVI
jgi:hypothetical protein